MRMTTYLKTIIIHFTYCMREKSWEAKWLYYTVTNLWFIQTCGQWSADDNHSFVPSMYNLHSGLKSHKTSSLEISPHGVWIVGFLNIFLSNETVQPQPANTNIYCIDFPCTHCVSILLCYRQDPV